MISIRRPWVASLLVCVPLSICGTQATEPFLGPQVQKKIDAAARAMIANRTTAGIAVGVVRGGQLVFNRSYGSANLELAVPVNGSTVFRLASLTKQFTAASVLMLSEQGKLSLEDRLAKFYPDFPRGKEITVRHLLNHTSGIRDYIEAFPQELHPQWDAPKLVQRLHSAGFDFDPGTRWHYSNSGYYLLGQIIEKNVRQILRGLHQEQAFRAARHDGYVRGLRV